MKHPLKQAEFTKTKVEQPSGWSEEDQKIHWETYGKFAAEKKRALEQDSINKAEVAKWEKSRPKYNPNFNDSTLVKASYIPKHLQGVTLPPVKKPGFKGKIMSILKRFIDN